MTYLVFKTTCIDKGKLLWEGAFSFTRRTLFPPLDKKNTRDKAQGLRITSERYIGMSWVRNALALKLEGRTRGNILYK